MRSERVHPARLSVVRRLATSALVSFLAAASLLGCERTKIVNSAVDQFPRSAQELDFLEVLDGQLAVTNNDALHGFILFADGTDLASDYQGRVEIARRREWVGAHWDPPAGESAQIGWMAEAACRIVGIKGGLTMRVFGPLPRYATKELVAMEVLPLRTENQSLTGKEFVDFLNRLGRVQKYGRPMALDANENQAGAGVIPAGAPDQLLDQSAVEFGLPTSVVAPVAPPPPPISDTP